MLAGRRGPGEIIKIVFKGKLNLNVKKSELHRTLPSRKLTVFIYLLKKDDL